MKLGKSVLLEIVALVQEGIMKGEDISEKLRQIDVKRCIRSADDDASFVGQALSEEDTVELSVDYVTAHPRSSDWEETN